MAYHGSNYPPTWASNSGPPPPPGGGYGGYGPGPGYGGYGGGAYGQSAYNVNQYPMGAQAPPGFGGGFTYSHGGAGGAGFTQPQGMSMPQSRYYAMAQQSLNPYGMQSQMIQQMMMMQNPNDPQMQAYRQMQQQQQQMQQRRNCAVDDNDEDDKARELERKMKEMEEKYMKKFEEMSKADESVKEQLKESFIKELMRRQKVSGTFDDTAGVIVPCITYQAEDPVAKWFKKEKDEDISGQSWDSLLDAEYLRHGIKGIGTDENIITYIVSTRSNAQRHQVLKDYKTSCGRDLIKDLKGELSGDYKTAILACFESPARYDAYEIKNAIYGLGTDEATLIEILLTRTNAQIEEMAAEYNHVTYGKQRDPKSSLEKDIEGDCSGDFKRLLISASTGGRRTISEDKLKEAVEETKNPQGEGTGMYHINYEKLCDVDKCKRMAKELYKAGEDKWGTDEETFNRIFSTQDYNTLRVVYDEYVKISQRDILNSVERETSGDLKRGLYTIAQVVKCRPMAFADRLYKAMKGLGTDDSTLIRIVVSRSEIDMVQIKKCFLEKYGQTLWNFIKDDTSGDYKKLLLGIVGKN